MDGYTNRIPQKVHNVQLLLVLATQFLQNQILLSIFAFAFRPETNEYLCGTVI
jgi:hypothetical protein